MKTNKNHTSIDPFTHEIDSIPKAAYQRIVIVGGGFAGLRLARELKGTDYQVVMLDKNNYHQFQPLFYQVATSGLEPSAISFPIRKVFKKHDNLFFRMMELLEVDTEGKRVITDKGYLTYDYLVLAMGGDTAYFGMKNVQKYATPMKTVSEALFLRNKLISNFEEAYNTNDRAERETLMNVVVVGGGPTGVELAGAIAEMKKYALPYDYPTMDWTQMEVYLVEMSPRLLNGMSDASGEKSLEFLERLGVKVRLNCAVEDYDGEEVKLAGEETIRTQTLIWAAGIQANPVPGLPEAVFGAGGRIQTNTYHQVEGLDGVYVLGDLALTPDENFQEGHPQVAQVAIQQASNCAYNFKSLLKNRPFKSFLYKDLGTMATIGRKKAVVDLPFFSFQGFFAWLAWLFVHLMAIVGVKNRLFIFLNWAWSYLSFDASLRLLIRPVLPKFEAEEVRERMVEDPKAKVDERV